MQLYLNKGDYGGKQYIKPEIIDQFTSKQYPTSNRGAGFDKALIKTLKGASADAYGHFGFTGTMVWVDPKYNLVYVFLSNRVNVSETKNLLSEKKSKRKYLTSCLRFFFAVNLNYEIDNENRNRLLSNLWRFGNCSN